MTRTEHLSNKSKSRWRWTWAGYFVALAVCVVAMPEDAGLRAWASVWLFFLTGIQIGWNLRSGVAQFEASDESEIKALCAALATPSFAKVRESLRAEARWCEDRAKERFMFPRPTSEYWDNKRWEAAWRELVLSELAVGVAGISPVALLPVFWAWGHGGEMPFAKITGDELADALRDWALGETK